MSILRIELLTSIVETEMMILTWWYNIPEGRKSMSHGKEHLRPQLRWLLLPRLEQTEWLAILRYFITPFLYAFYMFNNCSSWCNHSLYKRHRSFKTLWNFYHILFKCFYIFINVTENILFKCFYIFHQCYRKYLDAMQLNCAQDSTKLSFFLCIPIKTFCWFLEFMKN